MKIIAPKNFETFLFKILLNYQINNFALINFNFMKSIILIFVLSLITSCKKANNVINVANTTNIKEIPRSVTNLEIYDFSGFEKFLNKKDDTVYVINFWATWCAPCVKELPYFEMLNKAYKNEGVEVILVSLDFPHLYEKKLKPFIAKHNLDSKIIVLNDVDMNTWIPKVDAGWSGSIPATIIYKNEKKQFYERSFSYEELEKTLTPFL